MATDCANCDDDVLRSEFRDWLLENGAKFPKIDWPSNNTDSGIRGAVALSDIRTGEHMIEIPKHLMMSPPILFADPEIGEAVRALKDVLHGDLLLTVFIMHELRKGSKSFYAPFLRILPEPGNISEWSDEDLKLLQDSALLVRAKGRKRSMEAMYNRSILKMHDLYPDLFPLEDFTLERFKFSFNCVQARAFGRRLPWTAMVPFADCLNHTNVQTKYDYDIDGNGVFRLFPTGANHYPRGCEVFNSYGRRPNENLLMDYGFAMLDNEWDEIELNVGVPDSDPSFDLRYNALFLVGFHPTRMFRIVHTEMPFKVLMFLRIAVMDASLLAKIVDLVQRPEHPAAEAPAPDSESTPVVSEESAGAAAALGSEGSPSTRVKKTVRIADIPRPSIRADATSWFMRVISASTELKVYTTLRGLMLTMLGTHETSVVQDEAVLQWLTALRMRSRNAAAAASADPSVTSEQDDSSRDRELGGIPSAEDCMAKLREVLSAAEAVRISLIPLDSEGYWKLVSAVTYRLTRKRILVGIIRRLDQLFTYFECLVRMTEQPALVNGEPAEGAAGASEGEATYESCSMLWQSLIDEGDLYNSTNYLETAAAHEEDGHRRLSWDYLKRFKNYIWDATNPLQWPEL